jgi:hypothetical protein
MWRLSCCWRNILERRIEGIKGIDEIDEIDGIEEIEEARPGK